MPVEIIEIIDRSEQGMTRPFICRGDDGKIYFVKGRGAGRRSLICEWVASSLARTLGLPVAPFNFVEISDLLISLESREDLSELGSGIAFGSERRSIVELTVSHVMQIPNALQQDVLAFDWWIKNGDRTQTDIGGNPNLFWNVDGESLLVLDHNQAFDEGFQPDQFGLLHPFRAHIPHVFDDMVSRTHYAQQFEAAMASWDDICDTIPSEWWFVDPECTIPTSFDRDALKRKLLDCQSNDFWTIK